MYTKSQTIRTIISFFSILAIISLFTSCGTLKNNYIFENSITNEFLSIFYGVKETKLINLGNYTGLKYYDSTSDELNIFKVDDTYYLIGTIISASMFNENNEEIAKYSINIVNNFNEIANLNDMDLKKYYLRVLNLNKREFYQLCYDMGEYDIKKALIVGAIANKEKFMVERKDIEEYFKLYDSSLEEYDNTDKKQKCYVDYKILEEKVINYLKKNNYVL